MKIRKYPICKYCYDKGFYTVMAGSVGYDEWNGRKYEVLPHIQKKKCTVCQGRTKTFMRKQIKSMLLGVRNGGFITPVLEQIMKWMQ